MDNKEIVSQLLSSHNIDRDWDKLRNYQVLTEGTNAGNQVVDYFTLYERLNTHKRGTPTFYEFVALFGLYEEMPYIANLITNCHENGRYLDNDIKQMKYIYNIAFKSITIFKPIRMVEILGRYPSTVAVLDPTMGWGGRLVGAAIRKVPRYIGIDSNTNLKSGYEGLVEFIRGKNSTLDIELYFEDAVAHDYSKHTYDSVITSLPYYDLEIYTESQPPITNAGFYEPLVRETYKHLMPGGHYILNISHKVYEFVRTVIGEATEYYPFVKRQRTSPTTLRGNKYEENIYVWVKPYE
jgi:hypothetical protein